MKNKNDINKIKLFVLDMDGTFYLGDKVIEGSLDFIEKLRCRQRLCILLIIHQGTSDYRKVSKDELHNY